MRNTGVREQIISFSRENWQMEKMYVQVSARFPWTLSAACHWGAISGSFIRAAVRQSSTGAWRRILLPFSPVSVASSQPLLQYLKVEVHAEWDVIQETSSLQLFEQQIIIASILFCAKYCGLPQEEGVVMEHIFLIASYSCAYSCKPQLTAFPNRAFDAKIGLNLE